MCYKTGSLLFILLFKIIVLFVIPIFLYLKSNKNEDNKLIKPIFFIDLVLIVILIILKITNNSCIINSSFKNIMNISRISESNMELTDNDYDINNINGKYYSLYKNKNNRDVYYFNNNSYPLSNKKITCENKDLYMKNYGNNIAALASVVSTALNRNVDPIDLLNLSINNEIFDCETGVNINDLINLIQANYKVNIYDISVSDIDNYINNGIPVLEQIKYNDNASKNLTCDTGYLIIYNKKDNYLVLNTSARQNLTSYICPDNTIGKYSLISNNSNDLVLSYDELNSIGTRYIVVERNGS